MLVNNEQIQGVNLTEVFTQMIGELPWAGLLQYIQANSPLMKLCTIGGHRLVPEKRKRFEGSIIREAEKAKFTDSVTNGVFAVWYPVHKELHQNLEDYFHSDEYKAYREEKKLADDEYMLPDEKMDALYKVDDLKQWKVILCFSPLKFTKEQVDKLLNDTGGNEELVGRLKQLQDENADLTRKFNQMTAEVTKSRSRQNEDATEIAELKKQLRQAKQDSETIQRKLDGFQAENRRMSQLMSQADSQKQVAEEALRNEMNKTVARLQNEVERVTKEQQAWQQRYEEQRAAFRHQEEEIAAVAKAKDEMESKLQVANDKTAELTKFADLILSRIDWPHIGSAMKLSPTMRRNFNSLIKKLDYEEDRTQTIEGTLPDFWKRLSEGEQKLVNAIARSNMDEVATGVVADYWNSLKDSFAEVQSTLEARIVLLGMLQDIFYQTLEMKDLEDSILGKKTKKKSE
ncbi:MAG: hypothetical protein J6X55_01015 [Victivallales bacterium]|nr:hypothetical protein [Victivallales bacterium]